MEDACQKSQMKASSNHKIGTQVNHFFVHFLVRTCTKVVESPCPLPVIDENGAYKGAVSRTVLLRKLYEAM